MTAHAHPPGPPTPPPPSAPARSRGRALLPHAAVLAGVAAGATLVAFVDPNEPGHYPSCPFLSLTGFFCPGCGMTRMAHALTHGDVGVAFGLNPLLFLLLPVFAYIYVRWTVLTVRGRPMRSALFRPVAVFVFLGVIVVYWVLRNLPFAQALAP